MKPKDLVTLKQGRLNLFWYPTWGIGTYLGRGEIKIAYYFSWICLEAFDECYKKFVDFCGSAQ